MNEFLEGKIKAVYVRYLSAAFGSALITSIYSVVDMAMVGQYQGSDGTAALAVVAPIWNIIYSFGLLMGIGGSVLFSTVKGRKKSTAEIEDDYFTAAVIGSIILAIFSWVGLILFEQPLLQVFGASEALMPLAQQYLLPVKFVLPLFLFNQMLAAFLRNDGSPRLATTAILAGGVFNMFADYLFVFTLDLGIFGAGLATAIGSGISFLLLLTHFLTKKNTLIIRKPTNILKKLKEITVVGFSTFFVDVAMGIITILFNRQIMRYLGTDALSIYGVIVNISTFVQCCAYSVGQAAQPIISVNFGARQGNRIRETLKYALGSAGFFSLFWMVLSLAMPLLLIKVFMEPSQEIIRMAPTIIRSYSLSFIFLPFNIFATYYFQAVMKPKAAFVISITRGLVISGSLIFLLPTVFSPSSLWLVMPITELLTAIGGVLLMKRYTDQLPNQSGIKEAKKKEGLFSS
ncbi:MATE family efflux transporter [uncultured Enterococcus sp.]|uniref:MATE family efflux transporter n=1 Tax=uncultured Enterococcus sp. TaxID=167972 RepID=UPI002AA87C05|nr:MATE family efflux transporter [uncultured Enterococcus sp.]